MLGYTPSIKGACVTQCLLQYECDEFYEEDTGVL